MVYSRYYAPDKNCTRFLLLDAEQKTPSPCPSNAPTNGLANILSSFTAVSARVYSLAFGRVCNVLEVKRSWRKYGIEHHRHVRGRGRESYACTARMRIPAFNKLGGCGMYRTPCATLAVSAQKSTSRAPANTHKASPHMRPSTRA